MQKLFSNIIIFTDRDKDISFVKEKITKMIIDLGYKETKEDDMSFEIDLVQDSVNNITLISSKYFEFKNSDENKSLIRKIAKRMANDVFMISSLENNTAVLEKYSFNKRIYDYIALGNEEFLTQNGYLECGKYMYKDIWTNHFVGRNTINDVDKLIDEKNTFFDYYELFVEILKLYGVKYELSTYTSDSRLNTDTSKVKLYFK